MFLEKYKFLSYSIIFSIVSVVGTHFYFDKNQEPTKPIGLQIVQESPLSETETGTASRFPSSIHLEENFQKASLVAMRDEKNPSAPTVYKIKIPRGKRLYNEAKMQEVAQDANIETISLDE